MATRRLFRRQHQAELSDLFSSHVFELRMTRENSSCPDYKSLVQCWSNLVWHKRGDDIIYEMLSPDCRMEVEGLDAPIGRGEFKQYRDAFVQAIPDLRIRTLAITSEGPTATQSWHATGTHLGPGLGIPPTGRPVEFKGMTYYRFRGCLITYGFDCWNRGALLARLLLVEIDELCSRLPLTRREAQVSLLMAERLTYAEIACRLGISPNTARRHSERVLEKLGVHRRQELPSALGMPSGSVLEPHGADLIGDLHEVYAV